MPRMLIPVVGTVLLAALLGWKISEQRSALEGPAGGSGVVEGATVHVSSRVGGRITSIQVDEGAEVHAGDLLVQLDCVEPRAALTEAKARLEAARGQADAAGRGADAGSSAAQAARAGASAAARQADALGTQEAAAARQADRLDAVEQDVSAAQRDQARSAASGLSAQVLAAEAQVQALRAQASAAGEQAGAAKAQAVAATQQIAAVEAAITRAQVAVDECDVVAPRDGTIQLLPFEAGELVGPGATLATLVDLSTVTATFYLPNAELAAGRPGAAATIVADAWPDRTFTGTVSHVATEPEFTPRNIQTRSDRDRLVYEVEVDVPNPDGALRPGMPVDVRLSGTAP